MTTALGVLTVAAVAGVAGWALENTILDGGPHYSRYVPAGVPFMPIYAVGGAVFAGLVPALASEPWLLRVLAYGAVLSAVEATAGASERALGLPPSWDYDGVVVDAKHAFAWTALAALAEPAVRKLA